MRIKPDFIVDREVLRGASVGLDADGTLVKGLSHNPDDNYGDLVQMITYLYENEVKEVFLATGRPLWSAKEWMESTFDGRDGEVKNRFFDTTHVLFDGALVSDFNGGIKCSASIPFDTRLRIQDVLAEFDVPYGFDTIDQYYVSAGYDEDYFPAHEYISLDELSSDKKVYTGFMINFESKDQSDEAIRVMGEEVPEVSCHYFFSFEKKHCAVINPLGVDKKNGIRSKFYSESDFEILIFFGDGENDLPVFQWALEDERVLAIPSPFTRESKRAILTASRWSVPDADSVFDVLKVK